jgi:chloramphenicol-sensitive protein RarD
MSRGVWQGLAAYTIWGLFPLYWKQFGHVPALQIIAHRIVWSFVALVVMALVLRPAGRAFQRPPLRAAVLLSVAAVLIGVNWFLYVWGVNAGFVLETSLGYFMTPLVNVVLGVAVLRERLRPLQWVAVGVATLGVAYLTAAVGTLPLVALGLAFTFGSYGLVKKSVAQPPVAGLTIETAVLVIPAAAFLLAAQAAGTGAFLHTGARTDVLLACGGLVTIAPLLLFASAVQRVPLSIVGLLQYVSPTIQFLLGLFVYGESFTRVQFTGFAAVWVALVLFGLDGIRAQR